MFTFDDSSDGDGESNRIHVVCSVEEGIKANQDVFLIDHAWTFAHRNHSR